MTTKKEKNELLDTLSNGHVYFETPCCGAEINLRHANLFVGEDFPPEAEKIIKTMRDDQKERRANLKKSKKYIPKHSEATTKATNLGKGLESLVPTFDGFPFNLSDCRAILNPIDFVVFEGLSKNQKVDKIFFIEVKTGVWGKLSDRQKKIKTLVERKQISFRSYENEK